MIKLSHSQKHTMQNCNREYFFKYIMKIVPKGFNKGLSFGKLFHELIAALYATLDLDKAISILNDSVLKIDTTSFTQQDHEDLEWQVIVLNSMIYLIHENILASDLAHGLKIIEIEKSHICKPQLNGRGIRGFTYELIPDLVAELDGKLWLIEYKTASRLNSSYFDRLAIDEQTIGNLYFLEKEYGRKFEGIIFRVIKKPSIRQKKTESISEFFERLQIVMETNYSDYFFENEFKRDELLLREFEENLSNFCKVARFVIKNKCYYKNTIKCSLNNCKYIPLCSNIVGAEHLFEPKKERGEKEKDEV